MEQKKKSPMIARGGSWVAKKPNHLGPDKRGGSGIVLRLAAGLRGDSAPKAPAPHRSILDIETTPASFRSLGAEIEFYLIQEIKKPVTDISRVHKLLDRAREGDVDPDFWITSTRVIRGIAVREKKREIADAIASVSTSMTHSALMSLCL